LVALKIGFPLKAVDGPVHFDNKRVLVTIEVRNERSNRLLTSKLGTDLSLAQRFPKRFRGWRRFLSKPPCNFDHPFEQLLRNVLVDFESHCSSLFSPLPRERR